MAQDIYVSFGTDTDELEAGFAKARAETSALSKELTALAREMQRAGATPELKERLSALGARLGGESKAKMAEFSTELCANKSAAEEASKGLAGFVESLKKPIESISSIKESLEGFGAFAVKEVSKFAEHMAQLGFDTQGRRKSSASRPTKSRRSR